MTILLSPNPPSSPVGSVGLLGPRRRRRIGALVPPGWPLYWLLFGYPLWWGLGMASFIWVLLAVPMALELVRRQQIKVPRGTGLWFLFVADVVLSGVMIRTPMPTDVIHDPKTHITSFAFRLLLYIATTIVLLYACNVPRKDLPTKRVIEMLSFFWIITAMGGLAGVVDPSFQYRSLTSHLLPSSISSLSYVKDLVNPGFSQVQTILGFASGRPKAPFEYTNEWGSNFIMLLPFFILAWVQSTNKVRRFLGVVGVALGLIPFIYSLNRGVWAIAGLVVVYVAIRLAAQGKTLALGAIISVSAILGLAVFVTPLHSLVTARISHPNSNNRRAFLYKESFDGAMASPLLGFGTVRPSIGNSQSVTRVKSASCTSCGAPDVGTHGEFWLILFSQGFPGVVFFVGFFISMLWQMRRDKSWVGIWCSVAVIVTLCEMFLYNEIPEQLPLLMVGIALWWRSQGDTRDKALHEALSTPPLVAA